MYRSRIAQDIASTVLEMQLKVKSAETRILSLRCPRLRDETCSRKSEVFTSIYNNHKKNNTIIQHNIKNDNTNNDISLSHNE